ncbi:MAG: methylated-DNA--[protein]-cysteine S-methyltransferase [Chloroflexi bacterium]|nr:methylated-DNA--[protein]-cysteine S-methyltransferase [Chloroflexota bacterium]
MINDFITWIGERPHERFRTVWTAVSSAGLVAVSLWPERERIEAEVVRLTGRAPLYDVAQTTAVLDQLDEYWHGRRQTFNVPINWAVMTPFQQTALRAVAAIPYGQYLTYADVAGRIGQPQAVRAVGRANATNPMPVIIPCHRVLGSDGRLHGYGGPGGLETKAWLLRLEGAWLL